MGATEFYCYEDGETACDAFRKAVKDAKKIHGTEGYSGTIAEKTDYRVFTRRELGDANPCDFAQQLVRDEDPRINAKRGPAGCVDVSDTDEPRDWLFFGWSPV